MRRTKTDAPEQLEPLARARIRVWTASHYPMLYPQLSEMWHHCVDWHLANGVQRVNWEATFRNWIREAHKRSQRQAVERDRPRRQSQEPEPIAALLPYTKH